MTTRILVNCTDASGATWRVEQPFPALKPGVVRFLRQGRMRKLLDQTGELTPNGWSAKRWQPRAPKVPDWLRQAVERRLWEGHSVLRGESQ